MNPVVRYGTVCSGIEAPSVAWRTLGWRAAWYSEIDAFPSAVLAHHYPDVPNVGDMTRVQWIKHHGSVDLVCGGTPCQSFSVAGLRKGLADPRGNLTLFYLAILEAVRPRWVVWENVPGVLSIDGGRAFGAFLGGLASLGYGFAYRILDAQYFGVPQRRRRVFVIGHLGDWRIAAAVLFERESLSGNPPPSAKTRQGVAAVLEARTDGSGGPRTDTNGGLIHAPQISPALKARDAKGPSSDGDGDGAPLIAHALRAEGFDASEDGTGRGTPLVPARVSDITGDQALAFSCKDFGADVGDTAPTLRAMGHAGSHANAGGQVAVAFTQNQRGEVLCKPIADSLKTGGGKPGQGYPAMLQRAAVRRLTPRECERLQGFPDDYTRIPYRGKFAADGPRYKALGNSMATPVVGWIGRRIQSVNKIISEHPSTQRRAIEVPHV